MRPKGHGLKSQGFVVRQQSIPVIVVGSPRTSCSGSPASSPPPRTCSASSSCTCPRFAYKIIATAPSVGAGGAAAAAAAPEMLCIAEEAGRLHVWLAGCSEQERGWVLRGESEAWLCLMNEVELLRVPLELACRARPLISDHENLQGQT